MQTAQQPLQPTSGTTKLELPPERILVALLIVPQQWPPKADESQQKWAIPAGQ